MSTETHQLLLLLTAETFCGLKAVSLLPPPTLEDDLIRMVSAYCGVQVALSLTGPTEGHSPALIASS